MFVYYFQLFLFLLSETKQTLLDIFLTARVKNLFTEKKKKKQNYILNDKLHIPLQRLRCNYS